jgi:hypothetical protein
MFGHLRIAIVFLAAVLLSTPYGMAEGLPTQSGILAKPARIILVDSYEDIKACQRACLADLQICFHMAEQGYDPNYPRYTSREGCKETFAECNANCQK